jgi:hypothetical protein
MAQFVAAKLARLPVNLLTRLESVMFLACPILPILIPSQLNEKVQYFHLDRRYISCSTNLLEAVLLSYSMSQSAQKLYFKGNFLQA